MIIIILSGTAWGFIEATLGGMLHMIHFPFTGSILGPIGFGIMLAALRRMPGRIWQICYIPVIAAAMKYLDVPLFHLPITHPTIVRPATAILIQGLAFTTSAYFTKGIKRRSIPFVAAFTSIVSVYSFRLIFNAPITVSVLTATLIMFLTGSLAMLAADTLSTRLSLFRLKPIIASAIAVLLFAASIVSEWLIGR